MARSSTSILKQLVQKSKKIGKTLRNSNKNESSMMQESTNSTQPLQEEQILLERLGGMMVLGSITNEFCRRVSQDPILDRFFEGVDPQELRIHQRAFFAMALTGTNSNALNSQVAHQLLSVIGMCQTQFDVFAQHLAETLTSRGFRSEILDEAMAALVAFREMFTECSKGYCTHRCVAHSEEDHIQSLASVLQV